MIEGQFALSIFPGESNEKEIPVSMDKLSQATNAE
jgi:hypothetical protein